MTRKKTRITIGITMARYDSLRKIARNKQLIKYKAEHPDLSWKEIGEAFGVSGARACKICAKGEK